MDGTAADTVEHPQVWALLSEVQDPEIPVLSIVDLGIVRFVQQDDDAIIVGLAPTYSGCPATEVIAASVVARLHKAGLPNVRTRQVLSPPWTSAWITPKGRARLLAYGIAPPREDGPSKRALMGEALPLACPQCDSTDTCKISEFGSTPCKALYRCESCREPFEYFKCI